MAEQATPPMTATWRCGRRIISPLRLNLIPDVNRIAFWSKFVCHQITWPSDENTWLLTAIPVTRGARQQYPPGRADGVRRSAAAVSGSKQGSSSRSRGDAADAWIGGHRTSTGERIVLVSS